MTDPKVQDFTSEELGTAAESAILFPHTIVTFYGADRQGILDELHDRALAEFQSLTTFPAHLVASRLDKLHDVALAEFNVVKANDRTYTLTREHVRGIASGTLGQLLEFTTDGRFGKANGWTRAVVRDELHARALDQVGYLTDGTIIATAYQADAMISLYEGGCGGRGRLDDAVALVTHLVSVTGSPEATTGDRVYPAAREIAEAVLLGREPR